VTEPKIRTKVCYTDDSLRLVGSCNRSLNVLTTVVIFYFCL